MDEGNRIQTKNYQQALALIRTHLLTISQEYGRLKRWAAENDLSYNSVIQIKNQKLHKLSPNLLYRMLIALGYTVSMTRNFLPDQPPAEGIYYVIHRTTNNTP